MKTKINNLLSYKRFMTPNAVRPVRSGIVRQGIFWKILTEYAREILKSKSTI